MAETGGDQSKLKQKLLEFAERFPFYRLLGIELVDLGPGWSVTRATLRDDLKNPDGVMHGGVIATLIDIGITQSILMTDSFQEVRDTRGMLPSVELTVKYLRPLTAGAMTCQSRIIHPGKRVIHAVAVVTDEQQKQIALGDAIVMRTLGKHKPGNREPTQQTEQG
jgi:acyl-CoA thioesterase